MDLYDVLGVDKRASRKEIKSAYYKKARESHPDAGGRADDFQKAVTAYSVLVDDGKRAQYDQAGQYSSGANTIREKAYQEITMIIDTEITGLLASEKKFFHEDIILNITERIKPVISKSKQEAAKAKKKEAKLFSLLERFKYEGRGCSIIDGLREHYRKSIANQIMQAEEVAEIGEEMLKILRDYKFEPDKKNCNGPVGPSMFEANWGLTKEELANWGLTPSENTVKTIYERLDDDKRRIS